MGMLHEQLDDILPVQDIEGTEEKILAIYSEMVRHQKMISARIKYFDKQNATNESVVYMRGALEGRAVEISYVIRTLKQVVDMLEDFKVRKAFEQNPMF